MPHRLMFIVLFRPSITTLCARPKVLVHNAPFLLHHHFYFSFSHFSQSICSTFLPLICSYSDSILSFYHSSHFTTPFPSPSHPFSIIPLPLYDMLSQFFPSLSTMPLFLLSFSSTVTLPLSKTPYVIIFHQMSSCSLLLPFSTLRPLSYLAPS